MYANPRKSAYAKREINATNSAYFACLSPVASLEIHRAFLHLLISSETFECL